MEDNLSERIENLLVVANSYVCSKQRVKAVNMIVKAEKLYSELGYNEHIETEIDKLIKNVGAGILRI